MNLDDLRRALVEGGFRPDSYSLEGGLREDRITLDEAHGRWFVYYVERGKRWEEAQFENEHSACVEFLKRISRDSVAREQP